MPNLFYQANFCAECGNSLDQRERRRPRYFCDDCAARINRRGYLTPLSLLVALVFISLTFRERAPTARLDQSQLFIPPAAVSAHDATAGKVLQLKSKTEDRFLCGARTRKGTP